MDRSPIIDIFSKPISGDEIKLQLDSNNIVISHDFVLEVLKNLRSNPTVAVKFFNWILERESKRLSSNSYNLMVGILGSNGFVKEFWDMVESMKKKGYGVKKGAYDCVLAKFEKEGLKSDLQRLKALFDYRKPDDSAEVISGKISKIIRPAIWGEDVESKIRDLGVEFLSDVVKMVVESLATEPTKALIFFRWVAESGLLRHDEQTYNAMALVLGREDCVDRFWNVVGEMRSAGYELLMETFVKVVDRFCKRKMLKDCVDLYEVAMMNTGPNKPSIHDCTFLLKKVAAAKELDMDLFSKAVKIVAESGNEMPDSTVNSVLKSLASVGRLEKSRLIIDAMREAGLEPSARVKGNIGFRLSRSGKNNEATESYMQDLETNDHHTWISVFRGHCLSGNLDKAAECFKKAVELDGGVASGHDMEMLMDSYCRQGKAAEASGILTNLVKEKGVKPKHTTYKMVISQLLGRRGCFKEALDLVGLMKGDGFPPYIDPFVEFVASKRGGNVQDALAFFKGMTDNEFPSTSVVLRVFEAYFKAGRSRDAQSLLAICPNFIRNNADVLDLFYNCMDTKTSAKGADIVSA